MLVSRSPWCRRRWPALLLAAASITCGGDDLLLPDEGDPAAVAISSGDGQTGRVGEPLPDSLVLRVTDTRGRPVVDQRVVFEPGPGSAGADLSPDTAITDGDGRAASRWVLGTVAGEQRVTARVLAPGPELEAVFTAEATPGPAAALEAAGGGDQTGTVGSTLPDPLAVRVRDRFGNPVPGYPVAWSAGAGGSVSAPSAPTDAAGVSSVRWTLGPAAGAQAATAAAAGLEGSPVTFQAMAVVGSAGSLTIVRQPSASAPSGMAFPVQPQLQLRDRHGNPVARGGVAVIAAIAAGPAGAQLVGSGVAATDGSGIATFTDLGIRGPTGRYTINFSGVDLTGATSDEIAIGAGAPTRLVFRREPGAVAAGAAIAPPVQVAITDASGNTVPTATHQVTVSLGANPAGGTLSGTRTAPAVNGVASFDDLSIDRPGTGYTLLASASGLASATSQPFDVTTGQPAKLALAQAPPATVASGQPFQVAVQAQDAAGNPVGAAGLTVTARITAGGGTLGGTATALTDATGRAAFPDLSISGSAGNRTLTFSSPPLAPVSATVAVGAGSAAKIVIHAGDGQSATVGTAVPTDPAVRVTDASDNPIAGVAVTFAVASGGGAVNPTTPVSTDQNGVARVSSWTLGPTPGPNTLTATAGNVGSVTFTATATAGGAGRLAFMTQPGSGVVGAPLAPPVQVQVQDALGNPVAADTAVTLRLGANPTGARLGGTTTVRTANGVATFDDLTVDRAGTGYTLLASAPGIASATGGGFDVARATTSTSIAGRAPASSVVGQGIVVSYDVAVNPPGSGSPTGTVTVSGGGAQCSATVAAGQCTLTILRAGTASITASYAGDANFTGSASAGVAHDVGPAGTVTRITGETPATTVVGEPYDVHVSVTVAAPGGGTPTGTITVSDQAGASCRVTAPGGSCRLTSTAAGNKVLQASYPGDGNYGASADNENHQVNPAATAATIDRVSPSPSTVGQPVTIDFSVPVSPPGAGTPTGTVTVSASTGESCSASVTAGQCAITFVTPGSRTLTASYPGDPSFAPSASTAVPHDVTAAGTSTALRSSANPTVFGQPVTFTADVSPALATGTVEFREGSAVLGSDRLSGGSATLTIATLGVGTHTITAAYLGNPTFGGSSATLDHQVTQAATGTAIDRVAPSPSTVGQPVTIDFSVTPTPPGSGTPSGTVAVTASTGESCSAPVGAGNCVITFDTPGGRTLTATYGGDADFAGSRSGGAPHQVDPPLPAGLGIHAGDGQSAEVGTAVPTPPAVRLTDANGGPVPGVDVSFAVTAGGGSVTPASVASDPDGVAQVSDWTLGTAAGANRLTASVTGVGSVSFGATGVPGPPAALAFRVQPSSAAAGAVIVPAVEVAIVDRFGNVVASATDEVQLTLSGGPGTLSGTATRAARNGVAVFDDLSVDQANNNYRLDAASPTDPTLRPAQSASFDIQ